MIHNGCLFLNKYPGPLSHTLALVDVYSKFTIVTSQVVHVLVVKDFFRMKGLKEFHNFRYCTFKTESSIMATDMEIL